MRWIQPLFASMLLAATGAAPAMTETPSDGARLLIEQLGERAIASIKLEDRVARRLQLIADGALVVDYRVIARTVLAYAEAKVSSAREIEVREAVILFVSNQIIDKVESVRPDKAEITSVEEKGPNAVLVDMTLSGPREAIAAVWTVKRTADGWLVEDMSVSGHSLSQHFGQMLARHAGSVDQLLQYLKANSPLARPKADVAP